MSGLSQLYPLARQKFATATFNWPTLNVKIALLASGYVPNFANQYISDISSVSILATSGNITNLAATNGYCTGDTANLGLILSPVLAGSLLFYNDTGTPTTSTLIAYFDTPDVPGLPAVLNGSNFYVYKNLNYGGWFRL